MRHKKLTAEDREKMASIGYQTPGIKESTRTTIKDERGSKQVEHFDGRVDAIIKPAAVKLTSHTQGGK